MKIWCVQLKRRLGRTDDSPLRHFPCVFLKFHGHFFKKWCLRSKRLLPLALHHRRHHSAVKGYKNWCNAMTSASTMVETMSKSSVWYVHQMAIYRVCNIFLFFFNSPLELTFWITLVHTITHINTPKCKHRYKHIKSRKCIHTSEQLNC